MLFPIAFISLLFIAIAFIVTEKNARYILAGYNTMSEAERNAFDIKSYIPFFRKFYIFLGISLFLICCALNYLISANAAITFLAIYPIVAHFYSISKSATYYKGVKPKKYALAYIILGGALLLVVSLMVTGNRESELTFNSDKIEITGMYGETLSASDIKNH
jgi:hypothetical protein